MELFSFSLTGTPGIFHAKSIALIHDISISDAERSKDAVSFHILVINLVVNALCYQDVNIMKLVLNVSVDPLIQNTGFIAELQRRSSKILEECSSKPLL